MPQSALVLDHARRMLANAAMRLRDADILGRSLDREPGSDSDALLRILGFEVLLKCAVMMAAGKVPFGHDYEALWAKLPAQDQDEIRAAAQSRMPGVANITDIAMLLKNYREVFVKHRYFYELYEGYTLEQEHELGQFWEELGGPVEEADVKYYPLELECLIYGVRIFIERRI